MAVNKDKNSYTMIFAVIMVLSCWYTIGRIFKRIEAYD